jgi:N6-L-threonylcarbamoyladenine synthase
MITLGIESSCDETSAAVVRSRGDVLSNVVFSQIELHKPYGGVVPEVASRSHVENLPWVIEKALEDAGCQFSDLDQVAFTYGPGLASSLLTGISAGKALAMRLGIPMVGINHMEAHIISLFIGENAPKIEDVAPFVCLVVSGGHTCLVRVEGINRYTLLGQTGDDAAGEAFDKGAKLMGLGYPGGPVIDELAKTGANDYFDFPRSRPRKGRREIDGLDLELCFSFSGLKTALLYYLQKRAKPPTETELASIAASYQEAIVDSLVAGTRRALAGVTHVGCVGGVSLNSRLRARLAQMANEEGVELLLSKPGYCTDNAAMVAGLASFGGGLRSEQMLGVDADPSLTIGAGYEC